MVYKPPGTSSSTRSPPPSTRGLSPATSLFRGGGGGLLRGGGGGKHNSKSVTNLNNYRDNNNNSRGRNQVRNPGTTRGFGGSTDGFNNGRKVNNLLKGSTGTTGTGMVRSNSLNNKSNQRSSSVERMNNGKVYRGRSPLRNSTSNLQQAQSQQYQHGKNQPFLVRSRGNE